MPALLARTLVAVAGPAALISAFLIASDPVAIRLVDEPDQQHSLEAAPASVQRLSDAEIAQASQAIDRLVDASLAKAGVQPNPPASDSQFLRRAYLAIAGRIPTADETLPFLSSTASAKRQVLIDRLMASDGRNSAQFNWLADLLRVQSRLNNRESGEPYIDWLKKAIATNTPYDRLVREMLTASGPAMEEGNGATGFWLRDQGMPLDRVANLSQTFLGTQIGCAQCHDHPFDTWKRRQFYEFSAYLHGSDGRRNNFAEKGKGKEVRAKIDELSPQERNALRRITDSIAISVNDTTKSNIPLPEDYQYDDAKPKDPVNAAVIFGQSTPVKKGEDPRKAFADWMTSPDNPRFALVIANREWKRAFGVGLIEPIDDIRDDTVASDPALMEYLTRLMVSVKFDLRRFEAIIYSTKAWQRQAVRADRDPAITYAFVGPLEKRLSAEQLWDSLVALTVADADQRKGEDASAVYTFYKEHKDLSIDQIIQMAKDTIKARQIGEQIKKQADILRNNMKTAKGEDAQKLRAQMKALNEQRQALSERADPARYQRGQRGNKDGLLRASELQQPTQPGHFLRVFGQSDRELIENASESPAVTQALQLLNGPFEEQLFRKGSPLVQTLSKATDEISRVRACYLTLLSRPPTQDELKVGTAYLVRYGDEGLHDLVWALINANEFIFQP